MMKTSISALWRDDNIGCRVRWPGTALRMGRDDTRQQMWRRLQQALTRARSNASAKVNIAVARNIGGEGSTQVVSKHQHAPVRQQSDRARKRDGGGRTSRG